jgi:hypothetical protein
VGLHHRPGLVAFPVGVYWLLSGSPFPGTLPRAATGLAAIGALLGLAVGAGQWHALGVRQPAFWPWVLGMGLAHAASWGVGAAVIANREGALASGPLGLALFVVGVLAPAIGGCLSGLVVVWLVPWQTPPGTADTAGE